MEELNEKALSLKVQQEQLCVGGSKLSELDRGIDNLKEYQSETDYMIQKLKTDLEGLGVSYDEFSDLDEADRLLLELQLESQEDLGVSYDELSDLDEADRLMLELQLESQEILEQPKLKRVETLNLNHILNDDMSWEDYILSVNDYAQRNRINTVNAFERLLTNSQEAELKNRIQKEFTYKAPNCDKIDYAIASTSGLLCGIIDIVFVGAPGESPLGDSVDQFANKATEKFAGILGWDSEKAEAKGANTTASAIGFLEGKFKVNYDQTTTASVDGVVPNLSLKNHHLKSLGHSPDLIGLFFSVLNQFTNTSTFISNGKVITVDTETNELQGGNIIAKVFCGIANWFGHIMSDWTGSSGTVGKGGRGTGVPIPFYNLLLGLNVGNFDKNKQSIATIATRVFEEGYDARHGITMAIPVVINELIIRLCWMIRARFSYNKEWKDCIPTESNPELRRMLCVGQGALCLVDGADAAIRGGGQVIATLLRVNLFAWTRFAHLALKELNAWAMQGKINHELMDVYLDQEFEEILGSSYARNR